MSNYYSITTTFVPGAKVRSDEVNSEFTAISVAFDLLPAAADAISSGRAYRGVEAGSGNSYTITMDDTRTAYADGDRVLFKATHSNTAAASLKLDALSLISLTNADGTACVANDIISGQYYEAVYSSVSNKWQLLSPNASVLVSGALLVGYAQEWAVKAEDSLISIAAGGDGATDYSALHWAAKAAADVVLTNADVVLTNADVVLTNADVVLTGLDVVSTNADVVSTNADVTYTAEWAVKAEDSLISVAAGGNGTTDYSALHWAAKADASATAAAASESNADGYATAASADAVSTAADAVSTAADAVSTAADAVSTDADVTASAASAAAAATSYDEFDDRYLGDKTADPTLDNDGDALLTGALYWNTTSDVLKVYDGAAWQLASVSPGTHYTKTEIDALERLNLFINGCFRVWERGETFAAVATGTYVADRWRNIKSGVTGVATITKELTSANVPFSTYLQFDVTTADATLAATDFWHIKTTIEANDIAGMMFGKADARNIAMSFYHAHTKTGTHTVSFRNASDNRSYVATYTQAVADTWEKSSVLLTADTTGTWVDDDDTAGLAVSFVVAAGTDHHTTADTWQATSEWGVTGMENNLDSTANFMRIAEVQLEVNDTATAFERRPMEQELALCQRYFVAMQAAASGFGYASSTTNVVSTLPTPVTMRGTPSLSWVGGTISDVRLKGAGGDLTPTATGSVAVKPFGLQVFWTVSGATANEAYDVYNGAKVLWINGEI